MRRYQLLRSYQSVLILKPDIEESRVDEALAKIGEFIKSNGGAILKTEKRSSAARRLVGAAVE